MNKKKLSLALYRIQTHAEIANDIDPNQIVYRHKDIVSLLKKLGYEVDDVYEFYKHLGGKSNKKVNKAWQKILKSVRGKIGMLSPPGDTLKEILEERKISLDDFANQMEITILYAEGIISGSMIIDKTIALRLEKLLGVNHEFWLNREKNYRDQLEIYEQVLAQKKL